MPSLRLSRIALVVATAVIAASGAEQPAPAADAASFAGRWVLAESEMDGKRTQADAAKPIALTIADDGSYRVEGPFADQGALAIDAAAKPTAIDCRSVGGNTVPAIIHRDGARLEVCYRLGRGERPKEFAAPAGSGCWLVVYALDPAKPGN